MLLTAFFSPKVCYVPEWLHRWVQYKSSSIKKVFHLMVHVKTRNNSFVNFLYLQSCVKCILHLLLGSKIFWMEDHPHPFFNFKDSKAWFVRKNSKNFYKTNKALKYWTSELCVWLGTCLYKNGTQFVPLIENNYFAV